MWQNTVTLETPKKLYQLIFWNGGGQLQLFVLLVVTTAGGGFTSTPYVTSTIAVITFRTTYVSVSLCG